MYISFGIKASSDLVLKPPPPHASNLPLKNPQTQFPFSMSKVLDSSLSSSMYLEEKFEALMKSHQIIGSSNVELVN